MHGDTAWNRVFWIYSTRMKRMRTYCAARSKLACVAYGLFLTMRKWDTAFEGVNSTHS